VFFLALCYQANRFYLLLPIGYYDLVLTIIDDDLRTEDGIAGITGLIDGCEFEDDRIILRIALVQIVGPGQLELELSFLLVRELRDRPCHRIRTDGADAQGDLVEPVADGDKGTFAEIRRLGLEIQDDVQASVLRDLGIDGFYLKGRLGAAVRFTTARYRQEEEG
jgi:hypothetical protein